jgi:hypothetical protein
MHGTGLTNSRYLARAPRLNRDSAASHKTCCQAACSCIMVFLTRWSTVTLVPQLVPARRVHARYRVDQFPLSSTSAAAESRLRGYPQDHFPGRMLYIFVFLTRWSMVTPVQELVFDR